MIEIKSTGEVLDFEPKTLEDVMNFWLMCKEYIEAYTKLRDTFKPLLEEYIDENGKSDEVNGYIFKVSNVQRMNYDKSALRKVLDEDELDLLLEPSKTAIDKYLKDNLENLGTASTKLRNSMVPVGKPYQVIKAEKVKR